MTGPLLHPGDFAVLDPTVKLAPVTPSSEVDGRRKSHVFEIFDSIVLPDRAVRPIGSLGRNPDDVRSYPGGLVKLRAHWTREEQITVR